MPNKVYSVEISAVYTIGKDFAFEWMEKDPAGSWHQLVAPLLDGQHMLPSEIAGTTAEKIANRVLSVTGRAIG